MLLNYFVDVECLWHGVILSIRVSIFWIWNFGEKNKEKKEFQSF